MELEPVRSKEKVVFTALRRPWHCTYLLKHKLLKFLHNLCQTEPLESREKSKDVATHLHEK